MEAPPKVEKTGPNQNQHRICFDDIVSVSSGCSERQRQRERDQQQVAVFGWGLNTDGQLGEAHHQVEQQARRSMFVTSPTELNLDIGIKTAACAKNHSLILSHTGDLYGLGDNLAG